MKFTRLRLSGFKSFVEPSELLIEPGLTGVVGPNGVGKSNLLEGLRWVMGESSYKSMRASGMEDVIFNGSSSRPPRNVAEVTVHLDNSGRTAPSEFNDGDELEVSRRIEREAGSVYRINGRDVRARDVQLLFADASTGARSQALVRQGQINEIIAARPQDRRSILEEAAGITGLHTRRHEAELKLDGAETNLSRLDDVVGQLEQQLASLKRQARQAKRYNSLSGEIRKLEALQLYSLWREASDAVETVRREFDETARVLARQTVLASEATRNQLKASEELPALRERETACAAALQRLTVERDNLGAEERRAEERRSELRSRLDQIAEDIARERELLGETDSIRERLDAEQSELKKADAADAQTRADAARELQSAAEKMAASQSACDGANGELSEFRARRSSLEKEVRDIAVRLENLRGERVDVEDRISGTQSDGHVTTRHAELLAELERLTREQQETAEAVELSERSVRKLREEETASRSAHDEVRRRADDLSTEVRTLTKVLNVADGELWPPLIDAVKVASGYEKALGAALGEDLDAAADVTAPVHWDELPELEANAELPAGVALLSGHVEGPASLTRRLSHTGVVSAHQGKLLQHRLKPGQRLVSLEGDLWRWDGYTVAAEAPTMAAKRLEERNRLDQLQKEVATASRDADEARTLHQEIHGRLNAAIENERSDRAGLKELGMAVDRARSQFAAEERRIADEKAKTIALEEARRRIETSIEETEAYLDSARAELQGLGSSDEIEARISRLQEAALDDRNAHAEARARHDGLEREAQVRDSRLRAIEDERRVWADRMAKAEAQIGILTSRSEAAGKELDELADQSSGWEDRRRKLLSALSAAEAERREAGDALVAAETRFNELAGLEREAQASLSETREEHARLEARLEAQNDRLAEAAQRLSDTLRCAPEKVLENVGLSEESEIPDIAHLEGKLERFKAERERLGGVNLRAEEEVKEVGDQIEGMVAEREDVLNAINKLRSAIGSLNREARQRLLSAFDTVNRNFISLFTTLFEGGQAELRLTDSEDPLEAGLEVFARPPGKRTQVMSLLSGGEQALTATALIFAVFLTNPSPICVLDEVDAPLDDANVERFCTLLEDMSRKSETRFLIITHHPLTMSRMNRLFGVTMIEKGVSQLVSVDLEGAEQMLEAS